MRKQNIEDKKMETLLGKKDVLITEGRELTSTIEKAEKERNKIALKIQKIKDKMISLMDKHSFELGEFEYLRTVELKDGKIEVQICDAMEEWQEVYRAQKAEQDKS